MVRYQLFYTCHNWPSTRKSESPIFSYQDNLMSSFAFFHRKWNQDDMESRYYLFISIFCFSLNYFVRFISTVCYYSSDLITISETRFISLSKYSRRKKKSLNSSWNYLIKSIFLEDCIIEIQNTRRICYQYNMSNYTNQQNSFAFF